MLAATKPVRWTSEPMAGSTCGSTSLRNRCTRLLGFAVLRPALRRHVPQHRGGRRRIVRNRIGDEGNVGIGRDRGLQRRRGRRGVCARLDFGDQQELPVEALAEAVDEQVVRLTRRGVTRVVGLVGEAHAQGQDGHGQDQQHAGADERRQPRPVLNAAAPPVRQRLATRLGRPVRDLTLERRHEEPEEDRERGEREADRRAA